MIYGFAYLAFVLAISAGWIILAVLKKPDFIEKPLNEVKNKIRPFLNPKDGQWNYSIDLLHMKGIKSLFLIKKELIAPYFISKGEIGK